MDHSIKIFLFLCLLLSINSVNAQISSPGSDYTDSTHYIDISHQNHKIFVYYSSLRENELGSLYAEGPLSVNYTFEWSKFDSLSMNWQALPSESGVTFSELSLLDEGGYSVRVYDGAAFDSTYYAWVFINNLEVSVLSDAEDKLVFGKYFCGVIKLDGAIQIDPFVYFDPVNNDRIIYSNGFSFRWTTDNPEFSIKPDNVGLDSKSVENPPAKDMWIILTATDSTGMIDVDSVFSESVEVKSEFTMEFFDKIETKDYIDSPNPTEDDAPLKIRFTNTSLNGYNFEWIFTDTSNANYTVIESEFTENIDYQPEFNYKFPDYYYPALVAISEGPCYDTLKLTEPIMVLPSELEAPNVFSPEGLEKNRYFKVTFQSIKEFHLRIYSRTGNLVYKTDVVDMYSWDGWDGNIMNSSRPAPEGTYYYIIEATGYDQVMYNHGPYRGFVYLFRPK